MVNIIFFEHARFFRTSLHVLGVHYGYEAKSPPELGDLILDIVLNDQLGFTNTDEFDVLIQRYPSFSVDLIMAMKKLGRLDVHVFV